MLGFNRTPQLYVESCVWYSPAVVFISCVLFIGIQQLMFKSDIAAVITHSAALHWETTDFTAFHKGHFTDGRLKYTEKVIYLGESQRWRIRPNEIQSSWLKSRPLIIRPNYKIQSENEFVCYKLLTQIQIFLFTALRFWDTAALSILPAALVMENYNQVSSFHWTEKKIYFFLILTCVPTQ